MKKETLLSLISALLILLWCYTSVNKLMEFHKFREAMYNQPLPRWFAFTLIWCLPATELITAFLLAFKRSRFIGLCISLVLMVAFTIYIGAVLSNYYGRIPCSCGGIFHSLNWTQHLYVNIAFVFLAFAGVLITYRQRLFNHS